MSTIITTKIITIQYTAILVLWLLKSPRYAIQLDPRVIQMVVHLFTKGTFSALRWLNFTQCEVMLILIIEVVFELSPGDNIGMKDIFLKHFKMGLFEFRNVMKSWHFKMLMPWSQKYLLKHQTKRKTESDIRWEVSDWAHWRNRKPDVV